MARHCIRLDCIYEILLGAALSGRHLLFSSAFRERTETSCKCGKVPRGRTACLHPSIHSAGLWDWVWLAYLCLFKICPKAWNSHWCYWRFPRLILGWLRWSWLVIPHAVPMPFSHTAPALSSHMLGIRSGSKVFKIKEFFPSWKFELTFRTQRKVWVRRVRINLGR